MLRDRIRPGVRVLFVGINPGVRSALTGHHFAGYSNRFWKLLYQSGLVSEPISYVDDDRLPDWGFGITNIVPRATPGMNDLARDEYQAGARALLKKIQRYRPPVVALIGVTVWRALLEALDAPRARVRPVALGVQSTADLGPAFARAMPAGTQLFVLPNPSGRNANYSYQEMLAAFSALKAMPTLKGKKNTKITNAKNATQRHRDTELSDAHGLRSRPGHR
jgi:double-stranded uracil-DNA glycosylase